MARGNSSFHFLNTAIHSCVSQRFAYFSMAFSASPASATIGISTLIFLEIAAESISIWTIFAFFANSLILLVTRSEKRVPMEYSTSHSLTAIFAAYSPCMPIFPI